MSRTTVSAVAVLVIVAAGCGGGRIRVGNLDGTTDTSVVADDSGTADGGGADSAAGDDAVVDPDGCQPLSCQPGQCGMVDDGCSGQMDCGECTELGHTCGGAGVPNECGPEHLILHAEPGCFLDVADVNSTWDTSVGVQGTEYAWISIQYDTVHGGWRTDLFNREVLNHILFGFSRNVSFFPGRYILGNGAQIRPADPGLRRRSLFFGRVDLEQKPPGEGWTGYTTWRANFPWTVGETYHIRILLDAVGQQQIMEIHHGGQLQLTQTGDIPYFDPSLTSSTWTAEFGGIETPDREVKPIGWQFCNLLIQAEEL